MKFRHAAFALLPLFAYQVAAQPIPQDCSSESQTAVRAAADAGDKKAQYILGSQLSSAKCGQNDPKAGFELLGKSASQGYAPSLHLVGVIYRREGRIADAVPFFFGAAQQGFRLAEVDLGFAHSAKDSPVRNDPVAYAWLSLALAHEQKPELRNLLGSQLKTIYSRMSDDERGKADELKTKILLDFGDRPRFNDDP